MAALYLSVVIPRIVDEDEFAGFTAAQVLEATKAFAVILSLPAGHFDALAVVSGQGEHWRLTDAIRRWEAQPSLNHLLVANGNPAEKTYSDITLDYLRGLGLRRVAGVHVQAEPAPHTGVQAEWIAGQVHALDITGLGLVVSPYHLPRAYLTVLKALIRGGIRLPLFPVPVAVPPHTPVPETGSTAYDLIPGEVQRIIAYGDKGWIATPAELRQYLQWWWSQ